MKKTYLSFLLVLFFVLNTAVSQVVVNGVKIPERLGFAEKVRQLNGAGTRVKYFMHIYVGALYLKEKTNDPREVINADKPMSIRLQIISAMLTNETMVRYIREGFSRSLDGNIEPFREEIDLICEVFSSEPTKVGDVYDIHYTPGIGVCASKNGKPYNFSTIHASLQKKVTSSEKLKNMMNNLNHTKSGQEALPGLEFKKALFGIWFSDDPVDEDLKDAMLGVVVK